ncbi:MAG: hypothetical protein H6667_13175 [Ardenticatenaceae bacterium]|nr:hypothetical protein [Ardenticatenaceae bacterium]MCB9442696.1 hypothetical protein [Ardenticatenaceae bacterium]
MSTKKIAYLLKRALLHDGEMVFALYKHELEEVVDDLKVSMVRDKDEYIFAVTENNGHVAMAMVEKSGKVYINEQARERLKALWLAAYKSNMRELIPVFAMQLNRGELPINGVKQEAN